MSGSDTDSERVLVLAPRGRDAQLTVGVLARHDIVAEACASMDSLVAALDGEVGCVILTEEVLATGPRARLAAALARQAAWSDLPLVVLSARRTPEMQQEAGRLDVLGNVTLVHRPVQMRFLVAAAQTALRARRRQYEARRAIRQRDQFLAMLGHELRNPLGAVVFATEMLGRSQHDPAMVDRQREILDRQGRHLTRLVDDLLDVARVTSGKIMLQREPVDLNEVLVRVTQSHDIAARTQRVTVDLQPASLPAIEGDVVRLQQVFSNLLTNSLKYSPPHTRVKVAARVAEGVVEVSVKDQGVGIPADILPRVFDLFQQAETSLDRSQGGMGIGLTLVRSLVHQHGGTVEVRSDGPGRGTEAIVRLPVPDAVVTSTQPTAASAPAQALRVVVVDDNQDVRELTSDLLSFFGCTVATAADGPSGLATIIDERPDVAILDIGLPGLDGMEVARRVRAEVTPPPYLIAVTGYGQSEDRTRALEAGFDVYLVKPITAARLKEVLARAPRPGSARSGPVTTGTR